MKAKEGRREAKAGKTKERKRESEIKQGYIMLHWRRQKEREREGAGEEGNQKEGKRERGKQREGKREKGESSRKGREKKERRGRQKEEMKK